jgi:hypothetical protein
MIYEPVCLGQGLVTLASSVKWVLELNDQDVQMGGRNQINTYLKRKAAI